MSAELARFAHNSAWACLYARAVCIGFDDPTRYADITIDMSYGQKLAEAYLQRYTLDMQPPMRRRAFEAWLWITGRHLGYRIKLANRPGLYDDR